MAIRVGFLGAGLIATFHSKMLRASGEAFERTGVYDPDRARAEAFVEAARGGVVCDSEDEVLDSCDAVYICTWTSEHPRLVKAAAERGLAIFCEKPLATSLDAAREMADVVDAAGVANQVGLVLRRSPAFTIFREMVNDPANGRLMSVLFRDDQFIPVRGHYGSTWRGEVDKVGAGTLLEHSIHDIDLLEWTCGRIASVSARSAEFHRLSGIEDVMNAMLAFENGALGVMTSVWHDIDARGSLRLVEAFCERAYVRVEEDWFGPVSWTLADGSEGRLEGDELVARAEAIQARTLNPDGAFLRAILEGKPCDPDFRTAVRAHEVADAMYASARSGGLPTDAAGDIASHGIH
ncbi:MAG TPA: Gfo/Idh/MocA family oxidoreductase [Acidimicrobiales bacterium]|jgi:predicted dehydrogenase|nr:Gfo/Idh/MocA family oxidoreductase [Acidimicrobiales bacterium]